MSQTPRPSRSVPFERGSGTVVGALGLGAVVLAGVWWILGRPEQIPVPVDRPSAAVPIATSPSVESGAPAAATESPGTQPTSASLGTVTVDIRGAVRSPGVRQLPAGSRVMDAVAAAGGVARGRNFGPVNLARVLVDGEQIRVGPADKAPAAVVGSDPAASPTGPAGAPGALIDLNTATAAELEELDGVGPVLASAIVQWRTDNGGFTSVEDLLDVSGIGEQTLAGMRDQVTVG